MLHLNETGIQLPPPPAQSAYRSEPGKPEVCSDSKPTQKSKIGALAFPLVLSRETLAHETRSIIFA